MNKAAIRFLGIGLFLAGATFQVQQMISVDDKSTDGVTQQSYEQSQQELTNVKSQLAQLQLDLENAKKKETTPEVAPSNPTDSEEKAGQSTSNSVLNIQPGMASTDISSYLEKAGIIQNKQDFEDYLEAQGLSGKIQIGEYELNSTMTFKQIAETITK